MIYRCLVVVALSACGRVWFEPLADAPGSDDGVVGDGLPDPVCVERWLAGTVMVMPSAFQAVNSPQAERNPFVTADGSTLYFNSTRAGTQQVYRATRDSGFTDVTLVPEFNDSTTNSHVAISTDGLVAFNASNRPGAMAAGTNLWQATRMNASEPFADFTAAPFVNVNSDAAEFEPWPSRDLLRVYWTRSVDIMTASRQGTSDPFGAPALVMEIDSAASDCCASLTYDERVIVFTSERDGSIDLFYATRPSTTVPFSAPQPIPGINDATTSDTHSFMTPDGCTIYFISSRSGGLGSSDIWVADVRTP